MIPTYQPTNLHLYLYLFLVARGAAALLLGPGLGPWPLQCMHKSVLHAQECCACTRNKYKNQY